MGRCDLCGKNEDMPFRCRYCGGQFCADHCLPPSHRCIHADQWWFDDEPADPEPDAADRPSQLPDPVPGQRIAIVRAVFTLCIIGAILIAGYAVFIWIGQGAQPQDPAGYPNASGREVSPLTSLSSAPDATATPVPAAFRIPTTIRITPVPTPVPGIISWPHIVADTTRGTIERNYTFRFQNRMVSISATVNKSVYNGAKNGEKTVVTNRKDFDRSEWAPGYFRAFVDDYHQDEFYTGLLASLRTVRQEMELSDDEYLELMAVFVQSLEYDIAGARNLESGNRFPVETFVDGKGVCGDKSLLLAGLLSRERYDVALLLFLPEEHMALGVRSDRNDYRNTSYAFLETTKVSLVGVVPDHLAGDIVLVSLPQVISVGDGWRRYSDTDETLYIGDQYRKAEDRILTLEAEIKSSESNITRHNGMVEEHNRYATLYNYISTHGYDRPGTYDYVVAHAITPPPDSGVAPRSAMPTLGFAVCDPVAGVTCPAESRCCEADHACYTPCTHGVWVQDGCVCRV